MSGLSRLWLPALVTSSLLGCSQADRPDKYAIDTAAAVAALETRVTAIEAKNRQLELDLANARQDLLAMDRYTDKLASQISSNAAVANDNTLRDATARGDCGYTKAFQKPDGTWVGPGKIRCTAENYFRK